ncbi:MAG: hypothetical protein DCF22_17580 [Leptolyngbya sp.]|nr:MAG: hypothetical protein DCF22_17580 [Leptolyngbya sp.]
MSSIKRINVTLDSEMHAKLEDWAKTEERTVPNLLAYLARKALAEKEVQKAS